MLRFIIAALILGAGYYVVSALNTRYQAIEKKDKANAAAESAPAPAPVPSSSLEGVPAKLQGSLDTAQAQGPAALKRWLDANRRFCRDPKLGDVELDLAVALTRQNIGQARTIYKEVKARTPPDSPLQPRLKRLSRTFE